MIDRRGVHVPVVTRARIKHSEYHLSVWLLYLSPYLGSYESWIRSDQNLTVTTGVGQTLLLQTGVNSGKIGMVVGSMAMFRRTHVL